MVKLPKRPIKPTKATAQSRLDHTKLAHTKLARSKLAKRKPVKAKLIQRAAAALAAVPPETRSAVVLDRLYQVVLSRRTADPALSHSARLLARGPAKVAQKFGEEAVECLIEGITGDKSALVAESADVLYHLLLLWVSCGVAPADVWTELEHREGVSGIIEKAARPLPRDVVTRKIP